MCIRDSPKGPKPAKDESEQSIEQSRETNTVDETTAESDDAAPDNQSRVEGHAEPVVGLESDTATQPDLESSPSPDIALVDEDSRESTSE